MTQQKVGTYGTSCFRANTERFTPTKKSPSADFYVPADDSTKKKQGGYIPVTPRFSDPSSPSQKSDGEFYVPKGVGSDKKRGITISPNEKRFAAKKSSTPSPTDEFTPKSFVDVLAKKRSGSNAFGTGKRFHTTAKPAVSPEVDSYNPAGFAEKTVEKAKRTNAAKHNVTSRFSNRKSLTADVEPYVPASSVVVRGHAGKFAQSPDRMAKSPRPAATDADYYVPVGCGERNDVSVPRMHSATPRFTKTRNGDTPDFFVPTPTKSPCPAAAVFKSGGPRFTPERRQSPPNAEFYDHPSFVDIILKK